MSGAVVTGRDRLGFSGPAPLVDEGGGDFDLDAAVGGDGFGGVAAKIHRLPDAARSPGEASSGRRLWIPARRRRPRRLYDREYPSSAEPTRHRVIVAGVCPRTRMRSCSGLADLGGDIVNLGLLGFAG